MICSSRPVPRVATTSACVSPRVNNAGTVRARQYAGTNGDRTNGAGITAIDAWLAIEDLGADDLRLQFEDQIADGRRIRRAVTGTKGINGLLRHLAAFLGTRLFAGGAIGVTQVGFGKLSDSGA